VERRGGSRLARALSDLTDALGDYYGQLNEVRLGLSDQLPSKPEAMVLHDQMQEFGIPIVDGGLLDQPFIFMMEYHTVRNMKQQMELVNKSSE